jgi:hypothetical protein
MSPMQDDTRNRAAAAPGRPAGSEEDLDDVFEEWERYPARVAEERAGYQRLAWFAGALPDVAVALVALAAVVDLLRRAGRQVIRLWIRAVYRGGKP